MKSLRSCSRPCESRIPRLCSPYSFNPVERDNQTFPEADEIRKEYQGYIEKKLGDEWECMRDWGGKITGAMVRIAALMHAAEVQGNPAETPISPEVMAGATSIAEFLSAHAVVAYQIMGSR